MAKANPNASLKPDSDDRIRPMAIIGTTGLKQTGGYIYEERQPPLRGMRGMQFYSEMIDNCSVLGAVSFVIDSLVREVAWRVQTQKGLEQDREALKWKEWLEGAMLDMSMTWEDFISEVLSFIVYGFSPFEIIYKRRMGDGNDPRFRSQFNDGLWGWRRLDIRAQDTIQSWGFDGDDNGLTGAWQMDTYGGRGATFIPIEKMLLFRTRSSKGNPEGRSLLRSAVSDYHYWKRARENEAIGFGRDLAGMVVQEVPPDMLTPSATPNQKVILSHLQTLVQQVQVDERMGAVIPAERSIEDKPTGFKLRLLASGGQRQINTNDVIKRYESRMLMSFMAEFIMIGQEKVGTQSLFNGKSNLFGIAMGTILDVAASVINRFGIGRLMTLNGVPRQYWPELGHGNVASPELDKIGTFLTAMSGAGLLGPNRRLESKLLEDAGLPPPDDEENVVDDPTLPTPAEGADQATGILSERQVSAVLNINEKLSGGKIKYPAALKLLAATLGMDPEHAKDFLDEAPAAPLAPAPGEEDPRDLKRSAEKDLNKKP